jgi:hypothetical protein
MSTATPFHSHRRAAERAAVLAFALYAVCFLRVTQLTVRWPEIRQWKALKPLWPVAWLKHLPPGLGVDLVFVSAIAAGLWVLCKPLSRLSRVVFAVSYLQVLALSMSLAKISHSDHASLWVAILLCLAPGGSPADLARARFRAGWLGAFAGCQMMVALFYSLAGAWKVLAFLHAPPGWVGLLDYGGLGYSIAVKAGQTGSISEAGRWLAGMPLLSTITAWVVTYLQLFSLVAIFRPRLHKIWGVGLIGFHLGSLVGMDVPFLQTVPVIALLWIASPFSPEKSSLAGDLAQLPVLRLGLGGLRRVRLALGEIRYPEKAQI